MKNIIKKINRLLIPLTTLTTFMLTCLPVNAFAAASYYSVYSGNSQSIVDGLNSIGVDSTYSNRAKIAMANGIDGYEGTAAQNLKMLYLLKRGQLINPDGVSSSNTEKSSYFPAYTGDSRSIVDALNSLGISVDSSYENRKNIAIVNGISNYAGTAAQNNTLLNLLKQGRLKKPYGVTATLSSAFGSGQTSDYERAWFPAPTMNLSQIANESYSHGNCNSIDILPGGNVFAPFTGRVVYKNANWGYVLLQSTNKVYFADGTLDYMSVGFMHDSDISDIYQGQLLEQGTPFYQAGGMGSGNANAYGAHVDISVFKGQINSPPNGKLGRGNVYAYDAFYVNKNKTTSIINQGKAEPQNVVTAGYSDWSGLWKTCEE